ncbi:hypothetical protein RF11_06566 [Thelohanellus kitauei]|uniref:Uncharacterized protein n=1 Tax=Thelohanellus kitauei TaxID=669202 RepID=A0A0C2JW17_THEKT|nr:hypothetical protein RF11_06566 [Thelohanellus kitauei]
MNDESKRNIQNYNFVNPKSVYSLNFRFYPYPYYSLDLQHENPTQTSFIVPIYNHVQQGVPISPGFMGTAVNPNDMYITQKVLVRDQTNQYQPYFESWKPLFENNVSDYRDYPLYNKIRSIDQSFADKQIEKYDDSLGWRNTFNSKNETDRYWRGISYII